MDYWLIYDKNGQLHQYGFAPDMAPRNVRQEIEAAPLMPRVFNDEDAAQQFILHTSEKFGGDYECRCFTKSELEAELTLSGCRWYCLNDRFWDDEFGRPIRVGDPQV